MAVIPSLRLARSGATAALLAAGIVLAAAARPGASTGIAAIAPPAPRAPACSADNGGITLPAGFCAVVVADRLTQPRHLVVMPNGDLFVASRRGGVIALRDTTGDGVADVTQQFGSGPSTGLAARGEYLYSDATTAIVRYRIRPGTLVPTGAPDTLIKGLPGGGHSAKTFALGRDGTLYLNIGSRTNSCQEKDRQLESPGLDPCVERDTRAGVWSFRSDRLGQGPADGTHFGKGIRNAVAITVHPVTGALYAMQHGRDQLAQNWPKLFDAARSAETPSEELFQISKGDDFGWPYCYHDRALGRKVLAPEYGGDGTTAGRCAAMKGNVAAFPGHWAPNALVFHGGTGFPARYRNGAFVAFHGSWNRAPLPQAGFNVAFLPMRGGRASGAYELFATGFAPASAAAPAPASASPGGSSAVVRRPTGLAVGPDGSLYISDDASGRIWRVIRTAAR